MENLQKMKQKDFGFGFTKSLFKITIRELDWTVQSCRELHRHRANHKSSIKISHLKERCD